MIYVLVYLLGFCFTVGLCLGTQSKEYLNKNAGTVIIAGVVWPVFLPVLIFAYIFKRLGNK